MRVLDGAELITASPVRASIELEYADPQEFSASWMIDPDDPIFRGHYPGFLIYPGVCLIESAHQVAMAHASAVGRSMALVQIESARFRRPVFPGHRITVTGKTTDAEDGDLRCTATVRSIREDGIPGEAARIRLRYTRRIR
ncbi:3-hydroxyacyl-ACP dehydratase FabZ family protein [Nocardia sp. NPDC051321]|uniref:3-hydroxyacyl-ACP dehydratase FabZ family protein n=1 Tax=Nocardia sp. NPDC051321 TaxID=3364323 RepID=UPI0037951685